MASRPNKEGAKSPSNVIAFPSPAEREQREHVQALKGLERSPALLLVMALLKAADPLTQTKVCAVTAQAIVRTPDSREAVQAHEIAMTLAGYRKGAL